MVIGVELEKALKKKGFISDVKELGRFVDEAAQQEVDVEEYIAEKKAVPAKDVYKIFAKVLGKGPRYKNFNTKKDESRLNKRPGKRFENALPFTDNLALYDANEKQETIKVATREPIDDGTFRFIKDMTGLEPTLVYTNSENLNQLQRWHFDDLENRLTSLTGSPIDPESTTGAIELNRLSSSAEIKQLARLILLFGLRKMATDIHLEESELGLLVKFRIDDNLHEIARLPLSSSLPLQAYLKNLAGISANKKSEPQTGNFKLSVGQEVLHVRLSSFTYYSGEKLVIHIMPRSRNILSFEQLGMRPRDARLTRKVISQPHGAVLVVGPANSGKTTTLYALVNVLQTAGISVATIESPLAHNIPDYNQVSLPVDDRGRTNEILRHMLLQDADLIMLDTDLDSETLNTAAHAAMTGHQLFMPLLADGAAAGVFKVIETGLPDYLTAATINLVVAQQLIRKVCSHCQHSVDVTEKQLEQLNSHLVDHDLEKFLKSENELASNKKITDLAFYQGKGCVECHQTGYQGKIGVFEIMEINRSQSVYIAAEIKEKVLKERARKAGMSTFVEDALLKAKHGLTSFTEVIWLAETLKNRDYC